MRLETDFLTKPALPWRITQFGAGQVTHGPGQLALNLPAADNRAYHDAQISDYASQRDFRWRPPLHMEVVASFIPPYTPAERGSNNTPVGTAGFGFWNHPFVPGERGFRLPQAVWFFFSAPPCNMQLAQGVAGAGWKAATLDARRWQFLALLPTAPLGFLLMRVPALYHRLWPLAQRAIGVSEYLLDAALLYSKHTYALDWQPNHITFMLDGVTVHQTSSAPRGPLGFIAWVDNQYAVVTPQGQFGFGLVAVEQPQMLLIERIKIYAVERSSPL